MKLTLSAGGKGIDSVLGTIAVVEFLAELMADSDPPSWDRMDCVYARGRFTRLMVGSDICTVSGSTMMERGRGMKIFEVAGII